MTLFRLTLSVVIVGTLSSCMTTQPTNSTALPSDPKFLAQEQWDQCSHFPSVQLVEISNAGQLIIREKSGSSPPPDYLRCVNSAALRQFISNRRDASGIIRHAYFTNARPERDGLTSAAGQIPVSIKQFEPRSNVTFFYGIEALENEVELTIVWNAPPSSKWQRAINHTIGPAGSGYEWSWGTDRIELPNDRPGLWSVRLFIQGRDAGEYQFQALKTKS